MAKKKNKSKKANGLGNLPNLKNLNLTKKQKNALVGVGVAAVTAGAYYLTKGKVDWSFLTGKGGAKASGSPTAPNAEAPVDVALNQEVAESTVHNPNNEGDFTDDGATGNAD
ncbi:hypothetical protein [Hymenobacter sp. YC55]|uniref:hypothetical protein n=1 Tax=Hymenobacter sp. YC55 TaxID=3034019 RepID=UPI0023FA3E2C|nr:hypothetical protein [Hymenobacter sp. YC55]MDF7812299.1 hypothetical protein [Hymenobacter sp. YC55]